jgi:rRNA maturation endonuclease Nob1
MLLQLNKQFNQNGGFEHRDKFTANLYVAKVCSVLKKASSTHIEVNFQFTSVNKTINLQVRFITQAQLKNTRQPKALCEQSFRMWAKPGDLSYLLGRFYFGRGK